MIAVRAGVSISSVLIKYVMVSRKGRDYNGSGKLRSDGGERQFILVLDIKTKLKLCP